MSVKIKSILDPGNAEKERFVFAVNADTDVGSYLVLLTGISKDGSPFSGSHLSYWFPDNKVKAGDLVVLYTKNGTSKSIANKDGSNSHFYYWGLNEPQIKDEQHGIVLVTGPKWEKAIPKAESA